jgi:DNA-directed RNA polymerase subunit RPC12/RpoP
MDANATLPAWTTRCPNCGRPMRLVKSIPLAGRGAEQRTYECISCGIAYTEVGASDGPAGSS